ncbi:MAG TPA: hypothetical protein V6D14_18315 [Coleofasciculaceae cyanobacterium]|jgi:hypothetical protein
MQKFSETVYASLFWLISSLLAWLVIVPIALIYSLVVLVIAAGKVVLKMLQPNLAVAERESQTNPENQAAKVLRLFLTSLLLTTLIEVPALVAAIISLQPTRLVKAEQVFAQMLQSSSAKVYDKSLTGSREPPTEE